MAVAATRGVKKKTLLPGSLEHELKQGANKAVGVSLVLAAIFGWASLMSWSVSDPSLNRATHGITQNLLGKPGAMLADILFQGFGLAATFLILPFAVLGLRFLFGKPANNIRLRLLSWPISAALLAVTITLLPRADSWPLPQSYGGIVGDTLSKLINLHEMTNGSALASLIAFICLASLSLYSFGFTTGLNFNDVKILFHIEDKEQFKSQLFSPINRFTYWLRARQAQSADQALNQRHWWRNASFDETDNNNYPDNSPFSNGQGGSLYNQDPNTGHNPSIHPPADPAYPNMMPPPVTTNHFAPHQEARNQKVRHQGGPQMPPMSANPRYETGEAHLYDFDNETPDWANNADHDQPASPKIPHALLQAGPHPRRNEFILPPIELLSPPAPQQTGSFSHDDLLEMATMLENVLLDFGVKGKILNVRPGPVVTLFEFEPARGTKTSRIVGLSDDIARSMSALSARIAVIPGRNAIGIELPNANSETVYLRELIESNDFYHTQHPLPLILGKAIGGEPMIVDLSDMPHLLIAGTTGSGKSVGINTMLLSLLYRMTPEQCRMIMIDPKMLELSVYDGIPHLLTPVVTEPAKAVSALKWAVREMEDRYRQMSKLGVRNISGFNERVRQAASNNEPLTRTVQTGFDQQTGRAIFEQEHLEFEPMPMIVVVIDEMADLMMVAGKEIEAAVQRLAQMARAAGIHVIMATQRPSVDVITGTIKANFPTRISFQVTSKIDSRTILGKEGAEQLLGRGDMLFMPGASRMIRVHGAFVDDEEVERVTNYLRSQATPNYIENLTMDDELDESQNGSTQGSGDIYDDAVEIVLRDQKATISYLQRRLSIGYNRAATLIERMEDEGIVGPAGRNGKREIL